MQSDSASDEDIFPRAPPSRPQPRSPHRSAHREHDREHRGRGRGRPDAWDRTPSPQSQDSAYLTDPGLPAAERQRRCVAREFKALLVALRDTQHDAAQLLEVAAERMERDHSAPRVPRRAPESVSPVARPPPPAPRQRSAGRTPSLSPSTARKGVACREHASLLRIAEDL